MTPLIMIVLGGAVVLCLTGPGLGVPAVILAGYAMDPLRKVTPGQPVWLSAMVVPLMAIAYFRARLEVGRWGWSELAARHPALVPPLVVGAIWLAFQTVRGIDRSGSVTVGVIGLIAYLAPFMCLLVGFAFVETSRDVARVQGLVILGSTLLCSGILLTHMGFQSPLLDQVGRGLATYDPILGRINLPAGFFRTPEVAGWHAGMAACLTFGVVATRSIRVPWPLAVGTVLVLAYAMLATGRRKYILQVGAFLLLWGALSAALGRSRRVGVGLALLAVATALAGLVFLSSDVGPGSGWLSFTEAQVRRLGSLAEHSGGRIPALAITALPFIYEQTGFLGIGAGAGSQGAQYFGSGAAASYGLSAAEGGFGKVLVELGIPGLAILLWIGIAFARCAHRGLRTASSSVTGAADHGSVLAAYLGSNVAVFGVAHQVFGDPLVLCILGLLAGVLLRIPNLGWRGSEMMTPRVERARVRAELNPAPPS